MIDLRRWGGFWRTEGGKWVDGDVVGSWSRGRERERLLSAREGRLGGGGWDSGSKSRGEKLERLKLNQYQTRSKEEGKKIESATPHETTNPRRVECELGVALTLQS